MPRGAFKSVRGHKERRVREVVAHLPDAHALIEHASNLPQEEQFKLLHKFGGFLGDALPSDEENDMENSNGHARLLDAEGGIAPAVTSDLEAPPTGSEFFGWATDDGFTTVRISSVVSIYPDGSRRDRYILLFQNSAQMPVQREHAIRLMQEMGWKQLSNLVRD